MLDTTSSPVRWWTALWVLLVVIVATAIVLFSGARVERFGPTRQVTVPVCGVPTGAAPHCFVGSNQPSPAQKTPVSSTPSSLLPLAIATAVLIGLAASIWATRRSAWGTKRHVTPEPPLGNGLSRVPPSQRRRPPTNPKEVILAAAADLEDHLKTLEFYRNETESTAAFLHRALPPEAWRSPEGRELIRLYCTARFSDHRLDARDATTATLCSHVLVNRTGSTHSERGDPYA